MGPNQVNTADVVITQTSNPQFWSKKCANVHFYIVLMDKIFPISNWGRSFHCFSKYSMYNNPRASQKPWHHLTSQFHRLRIFETRLASKPHCSRWNTEILIKLFHLELDFYSRFTNLKFGQSRQFWKLNSTSI